MRVGTCAIIYWVEGGEPWFNRVTERLAELRKTCNDPPMAVSALSRLECSVKPMRDNDTVLLRRYDNFFNQSQLIIVPIGNQVLQSATRLRAETAMATPDAIQIASALSLGDEAAFLTNDNGLHAVPRLEIVRISTG